MILVKNNKLKTTLVDGRVFNDPIYGFIRIPNGLIENLIDHPYFQRLRRISQMGLSYLVFPGSHHTRFHHALGCMHLMQTAIRSLRFKKVEISEEEELGLLCAILLHDIGHGPFSHALEHSIVAGVNHEDISLIFMEHLDRKFGGSLSTAIKIFKKEHPKKFLNQLVSSQLDIDRLDYLKRDSFFTGVSEGNINSERLIAMLNVVDNELVIEEKGIYSVEKFLMARRFMYWQVYLHKTSLAAERLLINVFKRARELTRLGIGPKIMPPLNHFVENSTDALKLKESFLKLFAQLDDVDIIAALKQWRNHEDFVLSNLSAMLIDRMLPKVVITQEPKRDGFIQAKLADFASANALSKEEAAYFVFDGTISNQLYDEHQCIVISKRGGEIEEITQFSGQMNLGLSSKSDEKFYYCYPKNNQLLLSKT